MEISLKTSIRYLKKLYANGYNTSFSFPKIKKTQEKELFKLIQKHYGQEYFDIMLSEILQYHSVSEEWVTLLYSKYSKNTMIVQEIIMSGKAGFEILKKESHSSDNMISEYAKLGLVTYKLKESKEINDFLNLYKLHQSESMFDYTVKQLIVSFPSTPLEVLKIMAKDSEKSISEIAENRIAIVS